MEGQTRVRKKIVRGAQSFSQTTKETKKDKEKDRN